MSEPKTQREKGVAEERRRVLTILNEQRKAHAKLNRDFPDGTWLEENEAIIELLDEIKAQVRGGRL